MWGKAGGRVATGSLVRVTLTAYVSRDLQVVSASRDFLLVTQGLGQTQAVVQCLGISLRLFSGPNTTAYFGRPLRFFFAAGTLQFRRALFFWKDPTLSSLFTSSSYVGFIRPSLARLIPSSACTSFSAFVFSWTGRYLRFTTAVSYCLFGSSW